MEIVSSNYLPGDPRLIDHIMYELKSKGIFDNFRKECIADVDTKPAYQNLRQRVEGSVCGFLKTQRWRPDMNKNQVREMLRKNISESGFLETGVERIVDQVVNPKINSIFLPHVEDVVYKYLGVQKPSAFDELKAESTSKPNEKIEKEDINLLPSDLEAVSPESEPPERKMDISSDSQKMDDSKIDEDESPPFEPLEELMPVTAQEENSIDSQMSGFSGLASHDSNHSLEVANKIAPMEISNQDTQFSKQSSDDHLSIVMSDDVDTKMEINEDSSNSKLSKTTDTNSKNFDFSQETLANSDKPAQTAIKQDKDDSSKKHEEKSKSSDKKTDKHRSSDKYKSRHDSRSESKEHRSDKDRKSDKDKKEYRDRSKHNSKDGKDKDREKKDRSKNEAGKDEKDTVKNKSEKEHKYDKDKDKNKTSSSSSNSSNNNRHSSSSKDKNKKESSNDKTKESKKESSEHKDSKVRESDHKSLKSKESSSSSTSHKDSKTKERNDTSKSRDDSKSRSESRSHSSSKSKSDSRSHSKHNGKGDAERSSSKSSSKKDEKSSRKDDKHHSRSDKYSSSKKDDKDKKDSKKDDKKGNKDDHYALKSKSSNRRSTDRDSSDGHSGTHSSSSSFADSSTSFQLKSSQGSRINSHSNSGDSGNSDKTEQIVTLAEISLPSSFTITDSLSEGIIQSPIIQQLPNPVKLIKPKFASNIFEARRLMKIRKKLGKIEKQSQMGLIDTGATLSTPVLPNTTLPLPIIADNEIEPIVTYEVTTTSQEDEPDNNDNSRRRPNILKKTISNKSFKKKSNNSLTEVRNEIKEDKPTDIIEVSDDDDDPVSTQLKNFSKESWDAIEAKHLQNITYSYVDTSSEDYEVREDLNISENQKVDEIKTDDCLYLTSDSLQTENYFNVVNSLISCLIETIANKENLLRNAHDRHKFNKKIEEGANGIEKRLPKATIADNANDNERIISAPNKTMKNNASRTHRNNHNNNNKRNHQLVDDELNDHINHAVTEINNSLKSNTPTKTKKAKLSDSTANHVDDFNLPLSPAESEKSLTISGDNKKSEKDDLKIKQNSNINKAANDSRNQRYSTDDLYKPRLRLRSSRRRAAKNQDQDVN